MEQSTRRAVTLATLGALLLAGLVALAPATVSVAAPSAERASFPTTPTRNDGRRWRLAYYEGGEYVDYQKMLVETVRGLVDLGWIEPLEIPQQEGEQTAALWSWLAANARSEYLEFVVDAHYTGGWDEDERARVVGELGERLVDRDDIDLLIAMGTRAGKDFANGAHDTPTIVLSASDPIASGIVESIEDSGHHHVHATLDPQRYARQIRFFHDAVGFERLGIAYENSVDGRSYAAIRFVESVAEERGFEVVECHTMTDIADTSAAERSVMRCFRELAPRVDAIYVTVQQGVSIHSIPRLAAIAGEHAVPTLSQSRAEEVRLGFLLSMSPDGFRDAGRHNARTFAQVFNGARPNDLDQLFEEPPKVKLNLGTARLIGFEPSPALLGAADEIF